jgi:L-malate glycosyltransferase
MARNQKQSAVIAEGLFSYQIGGSERIGVDLAVEFSRRGYRVVCFAFYDSNGPMRTELLDAGIRCIDMNYESLRGISKRVRYQYNFWRMLRKEGVTALHVHHATALILCGIPASLAGVHKLVMTEHGLHQLIERPRYRRSAARYCRYAQEITVVDPSQADYFHDKLHVPSQKLHYVPNGVRLHVRPAVRTSEIRQALGIPRETLAFFYVGRLSTVKDLGTLLLALSILPRDVAGFVRLYLVGDGAERKPLEEQRDALGLRGQVEFLGARKDVSDVLMAADAFVMSSKTEGLPVALLEAMAAGLPCIATAVGGIPALLQNECGLLVPPGDPKKLSEAIELLARTPELRARLATNAVANVRENHSLEAVANQYLALLGLPQAS